MIEWSDTDLMMRDAVRQFVDKEIRPKLDELETGALSPYPIARKLFTSGYRGAVRRSYSPPAHRAGASVARSTRYASTRIPRLARPATLARRRGVLL